jgi:hypothetical protein
MTKFKLGDTVVFAPENFNPNFWNNLSEEERIKYYGPLGYGEKKLHFFTFICEHKPQLSHCMLISMEDQHIETMRHISDFRLVTDEES